MSSAGATAVVFRDRSMSYEELAGRVDRLAAALQHRGVQEGDRVAYLGGNHPSFLESMFATAVLGAIFVPLNTRLSVPELAYMMTDSGASVLISSSALEPAAAGAAAGTGALRIVLDAPDPDDPVVVAEDAEDYEWLLEGASGAPEARPRVSLDDRAIIIYTSGTTGRPKGAVLTHGNLTWNALNVLADYDVQSTERALMISPLFHVASLGMGCLPVLLKGAAVLLEERFLPGGALRAIERLGATSISGVPTTFQLMMEDPAWDTTDLSSLRMLTCGGSPVPARVREAYEARGLAFSGGYGMTETSPGVTMLPPRFSVAKAGSAGLPHSFTEFRIASDSGSAAPGDLGEIEVRGPNVFLEYWRNPDATSQAFTADGWLKSGDIGYTDDRGFLYIADRVKDMVISGGENIYSAEVEQAISAIHGVTGVAVIGVPHERWGEVPHAVVTLAPGTTLDPEDMVAFLSARLARYKVPRTLEIVDELPRTASGKVQKHLLRQRYDQEA
ncbi:MAG TPA: long-chain fatty acid--CoA ligase [Naasia sp.]